MAQSHIQFDLVSDCSHWRGRVKCAVYPHDEVHTPYIQRPDALVEVHRKRRKKRFWIKARGNHLFFADIEGGYPLTIPARLERTSPARTNWEQHPEKLVEFWLHHVSHANFAHYRREEFLGDISGNFLLLVAPSGRVWARDWCDDRTGLDFRVPPSRYSPLIHLFCKNADDLDMDLFDLSKQLSADAVFSQRFTDRRLPAPLRCSQPLHWTHGSRAELERLFALIVRSEIALWEQCDAAELCYSSGGRGEHPFL